MQNILKYMHVYYIHILRKKRHKRKKKSTIISRKKERTKWRNRNAFVKSVTCELYNLTRETEI